jgi:hypothetical protein
VLNYPFSGVFFPLNIKKGGGWAWPLPRSGKRPQNGVGFMCPKGKGRRVVCSQTTRKRPRPAVFSGEKRLWIFCPKGKGRRVVCSQTTRKRPRPAVFSGEKRLWIFRPNKSTAPGHHGTSPNTARTPGAILNIVPLIGVLSFCELDRKTGR